MSNADNDGRLHFASRLLEALASAGEPTSSTAFARAYNLRARSGKISSHGARKWLKGEAFPTQERILVLARWLNVQPSWLRFGESIVGGPELHTAIPASLSTQQLMLIHDISSLPQPAQTVIRDLVDSFLRVHAGEAATVRPARKKFVHS